MLYIVVRTYGNGKHMNKVYPMCFEWLSQAEGYAEYLNQHDVEDEKWIVLPLAKYVGDIW